MMPEPLHIWDPPPGEHKVLLHSCCAPCSCSIMERIRRSGMELLVFFYNPNIHPTEEYEKRKKEIMRYALKLNVPFVDAEYDPENWIRHTRGLEREPEKGRRCTACFQMRLVKSAQYARSHGFRLFTSSLAISRWKDFDQVTRAGYYAAKEIGGISWWPLNWRKQGGIELMNRIIREEKFYVQSTCGCLYSASRSPRKKPQHSGGALQ